MVIRSIRVARVAEISVKSPMAYWNMSSECPPTTARWLTPLAVSNRAACRAPVARVADWPGHPCGPAPLPGRTGGTSGAGGRARASVYDFCAPHAAAAARADAEVVPVTAVT